MLNARPSTTALALVQRRPKVYARAGVYELADLEERSYRRCLRRRRRHRRLHLHLRARVETIQTRTFRMRNIAMDALIQLINDIKAAKGSGKSEQELQQARDFQRRAQFYLDFVEAENSTGFHADQEAVRTPAPVATPSH